MKISIIVLNWNGRAFLQTCLPALQAQTFQEFEIVLVDNGSKDDSIEWLNQLNLANLRLLDLATNTGFSGGNLVGLAACDPHSNYIATLNNDTVPEPTWLETLVNALEKLDSQQWVAASGAMLFTASSTPIIAAAGIEVSQNGLALDAKIGEVWQAGEPYEVFGACAGAALYRRKTLETNGFFDPAFFAYLEDADLAWRLRLAGLRTLYVPNARVWHAYSGTGKQGSPFKNFQLGRNRLWLILKNWPSRLLWRHLPQILIYDLLACLYTLLKGQTDSTRGRIAALRSPQLKRIRYQRRIIQQKRVVTIAELERWLKPAPSFLKMLNLQKLLKRLAQST